MKKTSRKIASYCIQIVICLLINKIPNVAQWMQMYCKRLSFKANLKIVKIETLEKKVEVKVVAMLLLQLKYFAMLQCSENTLKRGNYKNVVCFAARILN